MSDGEPETTMATPAVPPPVRVQPSPSPQPDGAATMNGGRFDFDDGGTYCGGWEVCTSIDDRDDHEFALATQQVPVTSSFVKV